MGMEVDDQFGKSPIRTTERFNCICQQYPEEIQLSKKQRAKYWEEKHRSSLPKKHLDRLVSGELTWEMHKSKRLLYDQKERAFVVKNSKIAGTPKIKKINSQIVWQGGNEWEIRAIADLLHAYFTPRIIQQLPEEIFTPSPDTFIHFEYIFFYPFEARANEQYQDYINHAYIRSKAFEDTLVELRILKDDGPRYVRGGYARYVNVPTEVDRRLEIKIHFCKNNQRIS